MQDPVVMSREAFLESLLRVMEGKKHWAWPMFTSGKVPKALLHIHFEQEYATYVRDFPVMVGWAYVQCPIPYVRRMLAENLYEEETGGLVAKKPHPDLFLEYPRGLNMDLARFDNVTLLPQAQRYRAVIDDYLRNHGWEVACAVATLFIEGTEYERGEVDAHAPKRPVKPLEQHPLVVHYGLPVEALALTKAHRSVEGEHRGSSWDALLNHAAESQRAAVVAAMTHTLQCWLAYRDEVASACGLTR
jgi:pyrroloquinoline quinone (PQQ) biosynthesis protein C